MKRILLLGATGSIGLQTVDVIEQHPDQFCLVGIVAGHQVDVMQKIIDKHPTIQVAGISDVSKAKELSGVTVYSGSISASAPSTKKPWFNVLKAVNMICW